MVWGDEMGRFKPGQVVKLKIGNRDLAWILAECKEPPQYWCVALRTKYENRTTITRIAEKDLVSYKNVCWNCDRTDLNSDEHETCGRCGWVKCPDCHKCAKPACSNNNLIILTEPGQDSLTACQREYYREQQDG